METGLIKIAAAAVAIFAAEMGLSLLPEGNMKKFCKFVVGMLLCAVVLTAMTGSLEIDLQVESAASTKASYERYEDIIMDVYNQYLENNNN